MSNSQGLNTDMKGIMKPGHDMKPEVGNIDHRFAAGDSFTCICAKADRAIKQFFYFFSERLRETLHLQLSPIRINPSGEDPPPHEG
ncbi:hypothetical protein V6N11_033062 [Hibiscus sabdariffa]|uniref:Uncharacterized protein n=2 Tax=Hibiscus sabdariffa TaxID=183260 RepID=A0ABR1ZK54_9ROSI